ncbi:unnamed protein product [Thelazia callipaeda]|uniref:Xpo1 domain-containing protein n=1 Tax=Thelazia callipaeda TaxID=103827 RepID=A0A0N5CM52_THECL|nr:unnamed protein product [Thelazia callipaeda]
MEDKLDSVKNALEAVYNPTVDNGRRVEAFQMLESLKELAPADVKEIGHALIWKHDIILARTGWNFLEHLIKYKWLELDVKSRIELRNCCFAAMKSRSMECKELRCGAARCIVFIIQHEWPQNWPELFDQLDDFSSLSVTHAQISFIILQLLIENVITLATIENASRKKDLNNGISSSMPRILKTISFTLQQCLLRSSDELYLLARSALELFSEIAEWVKAQILQPHIENLICSICSFLETPQYGIYEVAAKCLWMLASRKQVKNEENIVVLALFSDIPMRAILAAANQAASVGADNVQYYRFLKTLCNVLSSLGIHLAGIWIQRPPNFAMYLAAIEAFFLHPSLVLRNEAIAVFSSLINHDKIFDDEILSEFIIRIIGATPLQLEKVGYPSMSDCEACRFSQHDYDNDDEFSHDFLKFRDRCLKVMRSCCIAKYSGLLMNVVEDWFINRCISKADLVRETEWVAMQRFSRIVLSECHYRKLLQPDDYKRLSSVFDGVLSLLANCSSPSLMDSLLSVLSTLLIVIRDYPQLLVPLLCQLRRPLSDTNDDDVDGKSVKRHCLALLLRIVTAFAEDVKGQAGVILDFCLSVRPSLSLMQLASCMQVVAALSNLCCDFTTQSSLLAVALSDPLSYMLKAEVQEACDNDTAFLTFFGFTSPAPGNLDEATNSPYMLNRREFRAHLFTLEGIMAQTQSVCPPSHPAYNDFQPILPTIFLLAKRLTSMYDSRNLDVLHVSYRSLSIFDITANERQQLLTSIDPCSSSTARILFDDPGTHARAFFFDISEKMQVFIRLIDCFYVKDQTLIGFFATKATMQLFSDLSISSWISSLSYGISFVPDHRLRLWLRKTLKPFLCSCPETSYNEVKHLLLAVIVVLSRRLQHGWTQVEISESSENAEPSQEELLNEHVISILTRESVTFLRELFNISDSGEKIEIPSSIRNCFLRDENIIGEMVRLMFLLLTFRDTSAAIRVIPVCRNALECLNENCDEQTALFIFVRSIQSLQLHGSDEQALTYILSLIFSIYSTLHERFPNLSRVLLQVPDCSPGDVERLNLRIASMKRNGDFMNDKMKREIIKKLLGTVIATSVGKQHRRPVHFRPLPPIIKQNKELVQEDFNVLELLFNSY